MPVTYNLIASNTLSSSAASVTFSAIPNTYTDLVLRVSARTDLASNGADINLRFNGNTSGIYSQTSLYAATSPTSFRSSNSTVYRNYQVATGTADTADTFSSFEVYIPSYIASQNKPMGSYGVSENNGTPFTIAINGGLFGSTTAISSILILPVSVSGNNFVSGSSFFLYGIKNS